MARRSAAQKRNDRRLGAMARKRSRAKPRKTKISKTVRKRKSPRRSPTKTVIRYRNPRKRVMRNPRRRTARVGVIMKTMPVAATAAVGAVGLDVMMGYLNQFLPANFATGALNSVAKGVGAIVLGMAVERVAGKRVGEQVIVGGMTVTMHSLLKELVATNAPQVPLAGYAGDSLGFYSPGVIVNGGMDGMTAMNGYDMNANAMAGYSQDSSDPY